MSGRFFLDSMSSKYDDTFKGSTCRLIYHPSGNEDLPLLVGKMELPGYTMQNKWTTSDYKSVMNRVIQAVNASQREMTKTALKTDMSYANMNAIYEEADKAGGWVSGILKALELAESESQRFQQILLKMKELTWGEAFNGQFHSTDEVCKYFTDAMVMMQSGFRISATLTHRINENGEILYAKDFIEAIKSMTIGDLQVGGIGNAAAIQNGDLNVKTELVNAIKGFINNTNRATNVSAALIKMRNQRKQQSDAALSAGSPIAWYRYTAPNSYKPSLENWRMGSPSAGTFSIEYGNHGKIHNLLVENLNISPSKSMIKVGIDEYSSNYYNVDITMTNGYIQTAYDFEGIV